MKQINIITSILVLLLTIQDSFAAAPTTQALNVNFTTINYTTFTINWTRGNGSSCVVFLAQVNSGSALPVDNTTYTASTVFKSGTQISTSGWYCVYRGTGSTVNITGLLPGRTYRAMVCEFNGGTGAQNYNISVSTNNPFNQLTTDYVAPTKQDSLITFTNITTTGFRANWKRGNGSSCIVFARQASSGTALPVNNTTYTANAAFGGGTEIASSGWFCIYKGTGTYVSISNLAVGVTYRIMVFEYNGSASAEKYLTITAPTNPNNGVPDYVAPTTSASNIIYSNASYFSLSASWTRGNGSNCAVFINQTSTGSPVPVNNTAYTADTVYTRGTQIGSSGWYCVYNGTGTKVSISGLTRNKAYRIMVCEYNGSAGMQKYRSIGGVNNPLNKATLNVTLWNGSAWDNGTPTSVLDALIAGNYTTSTNVTCKALTINKSVTMNINAGSSLSTYGAIVNNGTLILKSPLSTAVSGSLISYSTVTNNGIMSAERYISAGALTPTNYIWHYMSSPVLSFAAEKSFTLDYVYSYAESKNTWKALATKGSPINVGTGYMVKTVKTGGKTIIFNGAFNTGNQTVTLSNTGGTATNGYNLIGNPYPSAIDWNSAGLTKTNLTNTTWIWNPVSSVYATYNGTVGTNGGSRYIPAMQGFFVKVSTGSTTGSVVFTNTARVHNAQAYLKSTNTEPELLRLKTLGNNFSDETVIYKAETDNNVEKWLSLDTVFVPQVYSIKGDSMYSILRLNPDVCDTMLQIGFKCGTNGNYTISTEDFSFDTTALSAYLIDKLMFDTIKLSQGVSYNFEHNTSNADNRFAILLAQQKVQTSVLYGEKPLNNYVWTKNKKLFVNLPFDGNSTLEIYNAEGKQTNLKSLKDKGLHIIDMNNSGFYLIRIVHNNELYAGKVFIQ